MKFLKTKKGDKVLVELTIHQIVGFTTYTIGKFLCVGEVTRATGKFIDVKHPDETFTRRHRILDGLQHGGGDKRPIFPYQEDKDQTELWKNEVSRIESVRALDFSLPSLHPLDYSKVTKQEADQILKQIKALPKIKRG
ncbi:TPA: hypothetical protein P0E36_004868 [Vibrio harveyi]|nr:hypothetical protein [Vibrio harveyi]